MDNTITGFFGQYGDLEKSDIEDIKSHATRQIIEKGAFLLNEGDICKNFYLVVDGCLRLHYLKEGIDTSVWFSFKNNSSIELYSYISEKPSEYFIESIEKTEVICISKHRIEKLCIENPNIDSLFRLFWQDVVQTLIDRLTSLHKYSAEERYLKLLEDTDYLHRIPQKYLASYIGVTTTSLSRIKRIIQTKLS